MQILILLETSPDCCSATDDFKSDSTVILMYNCNLECKFKYSVFTIHKNTK